MFEDACCMCGKPTTGSLYCSNACKSQDYYPNLDDTPLLIPSRPQHSLSSSPTSSVMTTLSITDDLPPQVQPSAPAYGTTTAAAVAAAFARTSMPPTPGDAPKRTQNSKYTMPLFQPAIQEATSPALAPRKHRPQPTIDVENTLHYVRRAAHQRSASSSTTTNDAQHAKATASESPRILFAFGNAYDCPKRIRHRGVGYAPAPLPEAGRGR
ncbi:Ecl1 domain-containing protein [Rhizoctonia solani AG-1 IA]|uniref:Ecl1 domain-containing protein n=1 Tax=Thanatephorus cucumeris (strain AG1-IA) TaxID=983506 RepID=L8X454_THACA|nr:Ecl1 domain-containing protein [Rhizoctonia solani AG-1 IA]